jgi:hypothetical protein
MPGNNFTQKLLSVGIPWKPVALLGFILWTGTFVLYSLTLHHVLDAAEETRPGFEASLWWYAVLMHVGVGLLVMGEAYFPSLGGREWPLQWLIMSLAGSITALVSVGFVSALVRRGLDVGFDSDLSITDDARVSLSGLSIITSLLGDALLLSVLFAYFHRALELKPSVNQRAYAGYSPSSGVRYMYLK